MSADDDPLALEADQAVVGELAEQLVHALARAADHRREVALGQVRAQPDAAIGQPRPALLGEAHQPRREPAGDVEEMELLHVGRQASQLAGDRREQRVAHAGLGRDELAEPVARQHHGLGRADGGGARRSRRAVEQRQLAEDVAFAQRRQDRLLAGLRGQRDLHLAVDDRRTARHLDRRCGRSPRRAGTGASACPAATRSRAAGHRVPRRTGSSPVRRGPDVLPACDRMVNVSE